MGFGRHRVFDKKVRIDHRIEEEETELNINAEQVTKKVNKKFDIIRELNDKILKDFDINVTKDEKKQLKNSNASTEVISLFSKGLEFEEANDLIKAKQYYIKAFKLDNNFNPVRKKLKAILIKN